MKRHCLFGLLSLLCIAGASPAQAYQFKPMSRTVAPSGAGATTSFEVFNDKQEPVAIELTVTHRVHDASGAELAGEPSDDFLIYPAQLVLRPGQRQSIRVSWLGDNAPTSELAYRFTAREVFIPRANEEPEPTDRIVTEIQMLTTYRASLYVRPKKCAQDVRMKSIEPTLGPRGESLMALTLENRGTAHALPGKVKLVLKGGGKVVTLQNEDLRPILKSNLLAGMEIRYLLPWPEALPRGPVTSSMKFSPAD